MTVKGSTALISIALSAGASAPPPLPDLSGAEPQVRTAIIEDHDEIVRDPGAAEHWGRYGSRLAVHEYVLEAVAAWDQAQQLDPKNFRWPYLTGVYLSQENPQAALAAFERSLVLNDRYAPLHLRHASMMERLGRPADALEAYRRAVRQDQRNAYAHTGLGGRLLDDGNRADAKRHLDRALQLDPSCRPALARLVAWYRITGDLAQAKEFATRAAAAPKAAPPDPALGSINLLAVSTDAVLRRAAELTASDHHEEAINALRALVAANPNSARGRTKLGNLLQDQGQLPEADEQYLAALALVGDLLPARQGLARNLTRAGRLEEARKAYEALVIDHPTSSAAHSGLAVCLAAMGHMELAADSFRAALQLAPESRRSRVGYGRVLVKSGKLPEAIEVLRPVIETATVPYDEPSVEALMLIGTILVRTGRPEQAIDPLGHVLAAHPRRAGVRRQLAGALAGTGRHREAVALLREGLVLNPQAGRMALSLAWILATSPDDSVRDGIQAVQLTERWWTMPAQVRDGKRLDLLACAYAEVGRYEDAAKLAESAITRATEANKPELVQAISARLELFRQGRPYRTR